MMRFILFLLTVFLNVGFVFSQEIPVKEEIRTIDKVEYKGFSASVEGKQDNHRDQWTKEMKNRGKVKKKNSLYEIDDFLFTQITEKLLTGYTQISQVKDSVTSIWLGIDTTPLENDEAERVMDEIKGMLENYVLEFRKSKVLKDIQDAERAAAYTSRKHQKLISDLESLELKLIDAENEKRRLEESIKSMELEISVLKQKIENNKSDQEKTYQELEQIRKVLEMHKERLKKLN